MGTTWGPRGNHVDQVGTTWGPRGGTTIPPAYSLAICSNHTLAKAKAKANYDEWPLAGYPARKAGGDHKFYF